MPNFRPFVTPFNYVLSKHSTKVEIGEFSINTQWGGIRCKDHKSTLGKAEQKDKNSTNSSLIWQVDMSHRNSYHWRRQWHPTPVLLPGKSHGQRSLVGCSPWGRWESDTTEQLHFHFSLSCIGEGNGNPLQCSCLENPRQSRPGGLQSMGSHRVGHDWSHLAAVAVAATTESPRILFIVELHVLKFILTHQSLHFSQYY